MKFRKKPENTKYKTGKKCALCDEEAGTKWTHLLCGSCDKERRSRISKSLEEMKQTYERVEE